MPIYAEAKLGELLAAIPNKPKPDGSPRGTFGGSEKSLPTGISKQTSHHAQTIANNPAKVEAANELYVARAKLGELLAAIPRKYVGSPKKTDKAQLPSLPPGISKQTSHQAQAIAAGHGSGSYCRARRRR